MLHMVCGHGQAHKMVVSDFLRMQRYMWSILALPLSSWGSWSGHLTSPCPGLITCTMPCWDDEILDCVIVCKVLRTRSQHMYTPGHICAHIHHKCYKRSIKEVMITVCAWRSAMWGRPPESRANPHTAYSGRPPGERCAVTLAVRIADSSLPMTPANFKDKLLSADARANCWFLNNSTRGVLTGLQWKDVLSPESWKWQVAQAAP